MKILKFIILLIIYLMFFVVLICYVVPDSGCNKEVLYYFPNSNEKIVRFSYRYYDEIYYYNNQNYKFIISRYQTVSDGPIKKFGDIPYYNSDDVSFVTKNDTIFVNTDYQFFPLIRHKVTKYQIINTISSIY